jgi:hypothetical protein
MDATNQNLSPSNEDFARDVTFLKNVQTVLNEVNALIENQNQSEITARREVSAKIKGLLKNLENQQEN